MNPSDYNEYYVAKNDTPSIPLPNPGEGGPVAPDSNIPAVPLPNPGEGGPVSPDDNLPIIPLPNPGEGGPVDSGSDYPMIPLPNPGEGGPVFTGPVIPGSIITVIPRPIVPCFFCNSNSFGNVRFLNAATGYNPFRVSINNRTIIDNLDYAEISQYGRVSSGSQTVTVAGQNGYVYLSKQVQIENGAKQTIAVVNTSGGLDLTVINDTSCITPMNISCLRASNLSYNSGPLNVMLSNGFMVFRNIRFMETTNYSRLLPGRYQFHVSRGGRVLVSSEISVRSNSQYTIYIFNWNNSPDSIRTLVVEDRKS